MTNTLEWHGFRPAQRVWCPANQKAGTVPTEREARSLFLHVKATGVPVRFDDGDDISDVPPEHLTTSAPVTAVLRFTDPLGTVDITVDLCQLIHSAGLVRGQTGDTARCPSCEHTAEYHGDPEGCHFTVTNGRPSINLVCQCEVGRAALTALRRGGDHARRHPNL